MQNNNAHAVYIFNCDGLTAFIAIFFMRNESRIKNSPNGAAK